MLREALKALRAGKPVMIFDARGREEEVDLVYHASFVTWREVRTLRRLAGGIICFATKYKLLRMLGLRFLDELLSQYEPLKEVASRRLGYGDPPAFMLWINHYTVKTGVSDIDRAKTINALYKLVLLLMDGKVEEAKQMFKREFIVPGHTALLGARSLDVRRGHTELSIALTELANLPPATVFAEMLGDDGLSLPLEDAERLSKSLDIPLVTGDEILEAWREHGSYRSRGHDIC